MNHDDRWRSAEVPQGARRAGIHDRKPTRALEQAGWVAGPQVHDARIVSIMLAYRITRIVTLNGEVFRGDGLIIAGKSASSSALSRPRQKRELTEALASSSVAAALFWATAFP